MTTTTDVQDRIAELKRDIAHFNYRIREAKKEIATVDIASEPKFWHRLDSEIRFCTQMRNRRRIFLKECEAWIAR